MKNVRLVTNITLEGDEIRLKTIKVTVEDREGGVSLSSGRTYDTVFNDFTELFTELRQRAAEVFTSILSRQ